MDNSASALFAISEAHHGRAAPIQAKLGDVSFPLSTQGRAPGVVGSGQLKTIYALKDGRAVALPVHYLNLNRNGAEQIAANWERAIKEEKSLSDKMRALGLEAQQIEIVPLQIGEYQLPVMVMPSFASLVNQGLQVRDRKPEGDDKIYGNSMYFGTPENLEDPKRLKMVMEGIKDDVTTLLSEGIHLTRDAFNLVVKDTPATPVPPERDKPVLFDEMHQQIRLFLFDLASTTEARKEAGLMLLDQHGNPDRERIEKKAAYYLDKAFDALSDSILPREAEVISGLSKRKYNSRFEMQTVVEENYERIKSELAKEIADNVMAKITAMPFDERSRKFSRAEDTSRTNGQGWVKGAPPKGDGFAQRLG
jgi:hypothetical protein